jgi:putative Holliday junction resolvase
MRVLRERLPGIRDKDYVVNEGSVAIRILGIDFGDRRTGVAMSDPLGLTAQGIEVVIGSERTQISRIAALSEEHGVEKIIVGYPLNMDGSAGARAQITEAFISKLEDAVTCPVLKWDERLTSVSAQRALKETGARVTKDKGRIDIISAMIMLQSYLDSI